MRHGCQGGSTSRSLLSIKIRVLTNSMLCTSIVARNIIEVDTSSGGIIVSQSSGHYICETTLSLSNVSDSNLNHPDP
jgi:hypothetical protein